MNDESPTIQGFGENVQIEYKNCDKLAFFYESVWSKFSFFFHDLLFSRSFWLELKSMSLSSKYSLNQAPASTSIEQSILWFQVTLCLLGYSFTCSFFKSTFSKKTESGIPSEYQTDRRLVGLDLGATIS